MKNHTSLEQIWCFQASTFSTPAPSTWELRSCFSRGLSGMKSFSRFAKGNSTAMETTIARKYDMATNPAK